MDLDELVEHWTLLAERELVAVSAAARPGPGRQWENEMQLDSAGLDGTWSRTCVALARHTPGLRTPHGQNAVFTAREMEKQQVSDYSDGSGSAHCKTVGLAYVRSNPTPATT